MRRGINPLGVLDELRELGKTSIVTDPDQVPPLDQLDPERCYLSWTITVKTEAAPERLGEAFLFFAEDSTAAIQRLGPDGKWLPVRLGEAAAAAVQQERRRRRERQEGRASRPRNCRGPKSRFRPRPRPTARLRLTRCPPRRLLRRSLSPLPPRPLRSCRRLHARIRVDAAQLDDLVGLAGELVVVSDNLMGLREVPGVETWIHALEALAARQPADQGYDPRPADGPRR